MAEITLPLFAIRHRRIGGVESAIYNLARGLDPLAALKIAYGDPAQLSPEFLAWADRRNIARTRTKSFGRPISARFLEESWFGAMHGSGNILYPNYFLPPVRRRGAVNAVLIHDHQFKVYPGYFGTTKLRWLEWNYAHTLRAADHVFFISEFERQQAIRYYGKALGDRSHVIYNAADWSRYEGGSVSASIEALAARPYILTVAHQHPHKNLATLVQAFALMADHTPDVSLVLVGTRTPEMSAQCDALIPSNMADRVHFTGFISDAELGLLYRNMQLFALPSLYEGFGMPAVEALGYGRPLLLADAGALREVTMGLARYVAKDAEPDIWAEQLIDALGAAGPTPAEIGVIRARYSPASVAQRILKAFER